jgi:[acyl-carrier-protein] S-malonyltransferase
MGKELYDTSSTARAIFDEADEILGFSLTGLCFEGPQEELTQTNNAQPAIFTTSLAALADMKEKLGKQDVKPAFVAGHSLGEYVALVAADTLSFAEALPLVRERGQLMQSANTIQPGGMAAIIGLDAPTTEEICQQTGMQISNINSREQIVISGPKANVANALDLARARGAKKVVPLPVGSAFHSNLMEPTVERMTSAIDQVDLHDASVPIVANSTAMPVVTSGDIREELVYQLCHCVHWLGSVEYMINSGVTTFLEIGPGKILSSLVRRIDPNVSALTIKDYLAS